MNQGRLVPTVAGLSLALTLVGAGAAGPKPITGNTIAALQSWVDAVRSHAPGSSDKPVIAVATFSYETREDLNAGMELFLRVLTGSGYDPQKYDTHSNQAVKTIVEIGHEAGKPDADSFLKQAAILHADVVAYGDRLSAPSTHQSQAASSATHELRIGAGLAMPTKIHREEPIPPLLTRNRLFVDRDGEVLGEVAASWSWPFARSLIDLVHARGQGLASDPFVAAWYHATTAYMFATGAYGDLTSHLQRASTLLPDNGSILFDRGCYAELLGLPMHQSLLSDRDLIEQRRRGDRYSAGSPTWTTPSSAPALGIPPAEKTNAEAERLFRQALTVEPPLTEVGVRLARLLQVRKRHNEALSELNATLAKAPSGVVAFYAHLFAGRSARALRQLEEASRHYREALGLFPGAQSALLASSQLALLESDLPATLAPIERLGGASAVFTGDPWWQYHLCSGRDADDLLKSLWGSVPR